MNSRSFLEMFTKSLSRLIRQPEILLLSLLLFVSVNLLSKLSVEVNYRLTSSVTITSWVVIFLILQLLILSAFISLLVPLSEGEKMFSRFRRKLFGNLAILIVIALLSILIAQASTVMAFYLGKAIGLDIGPARFLFLLIYFSFLIGVFIFFTLSNIIYTNYGLGFLRAIRASMKTVRKNYLSTLSISLVFFVIFYLSKFLTGTLGEAFEYIFLAPLLALVLLEFTKKIFKNDI